MAKTWALAIVLLMSGSAVARADAVGPPPTDCPAGTMGEPSHTGPYCAPTTCTTDADCSGGATCRDEAMCIAQQACGGLSVDSGPYPDGGTEPPCVFDAVHGLCESGAACAQGTCATRHVCVAPAAPASAGCGCSVGVGDAGVASALAALIAIMFLRRRARSSRA